MIKFSDLSQELMSAIDEIELNWEEKKESIPEILAYLKSVGAVDILLKRWESASKMRLYLQEKKKDVSEQISIQVENEFKKKK